MSEQQEPKDPIQLSHTRVLAGEVGASRPGECPYVLFLGAGASVESGIPSSTLLIERWKWDFYLDSMNHHYVKREDYGDNHELVKEFKEWAIEKPGHGFYDWFNKRTSETIDEFKSRQGSLYAKLFEEYKVSKESRQSYIEEITGGDNVRASIGYVYLSCLLKEKIIGCVLTTNFDDLVSDSLFRFHDERAIVCAFESSISNFNNSSLRPKIIKLHGDYLFSDIRNTESELTHLGDNTKNKMIELCHDRGIVVIGYDGNDRSIMEPILNQMHRNPRFLSKGLHWCIHDASLKKQNITIDSEDQQLHTIDAKDHVIDKKVLPDRLIELKKQFPEKVHIYKIGSFDEFMCEVYSHAPGDISDCFTLSEDQNPSTLFRHAVEKYKNRFELHPVMVDGWISALQYGDKKDSEIDSNLNRALTSWEEGKIQRDYRKDFEQAMPLFERSLEFAEEAARHQAEMDIDQRIWYTGRKIAALTGIAKCHKHAENSAGCQKAMKDILTLVDEFTKAHEADIENHPAAKKSLNQARYCSLLYNFVCAQCNAVRFGVCSDIKEVKPLVDGYLVTLQKTEIGREKIAKLEGEDDYRDFSQHFSKDDPDTDPSGNNSTLKKSQKNDRPKPKSTRGSSKLSKK